LNVITRRSRRISIAVLVLIALILPVFAPSCGQPASQLSGLCFSPYLNSNPRQAGPVVDLLGEIAPHTEGIRTFGSTGVWAEVPPEAERLGLYMAAGAGLYDNKKYNASQVAGLVKLAKTGAVDLAVVGDENLMSNTVGEDELISYIKQVKATGVPTTTSDGWAELLAHPRVVSAVDIVIINVFPFVQGVSLDRAIEYLDSAYRKVKAKAGTKEVMVETGWPSAGESRWKAVPGPKNAARYLSDFTAWARSNGVRYFYFEAFDEPWKSKTEGSVGGHWGLWDNDGQMKQYARSVLGEAQ